MKIKAFNSFVFLIIIFLIFYSFFDYNKFFFDQELDHYSRINLFGLTTNDQNFNFNTKYLEWPKAGFYTEYARFFPAFLIEFKIYSLIFTTKFVVENLNFFLALSSTFLIGLGSFLIYKKHNNYFFIFIFILSTPFILSFNSLANSDRYVLLFIMLYIYALEKNNFLFSILFFALTILSKEIALASLGFINFMYVFLIYFFNKNYNLRNLFIFSTIVSVAISLLYLYLILNSYNNNNLEVYADATNFNLLKSFKFFIKSLFSEGLLYLLFILSILSNIKNVNLKNYNFYNINSLCLFYGIFYYLIILVIGAFSSKYFLPVYFLIIYSIDFNNLSYLSKKVFYILATLLLFFNLPLTYHTLLEVKFSALNDVITQNKIHEIFQGSCNKKEKILINVVDKDEHFTRDEKDYWDRTYYKRIKMQNDTQKCSNIEIKLIYLNIRESNQNYHQYLKFDLSKYDDIFLLLNPNQPKKLLDFLQDNGFQVFHVTNMPSASSLNHDFIKDFILYYFKYYDNYSLNKISYRYILKLTK